MALSDGFFFNIPTNPISALQTAINAGPHGFDDNPIGVTGNLLSAFGLPLPGIPLSGTALSLFSMVPLPSNFRSVTPSTYMVSYPMPVAPMDPSTIDTIYAMPGGQTETEAYSSPLQQFIAQVNNRDFAKQSKFLVTMPTQIGNNTLEMGDMDGPTIQLFCEAADVPGIRHETKPYHFYGPDFHRPSAVSYGGEATRMVFLVDQNMGVRQYFESWMRLINNPVSFTFYYPENYMSSGIIIRQLKHRGEDLGAGTDVSSYSVRLIDVFPSAIETMPVHYGSREIHRLIVTFTFSRWTSSFKNEDPPINIGSEINPNTDSPDSTGQTLPAGY